MFQVSAYLTSDKVKFLVLKDIGVESYFTLILCMCLNISNCYVNELLSTG